jgi:hypothetical protein
MTDNPNSIPLEELLGKYILIGITHVDNLGNKMGQTECHGFFDSMDDAGIHIRLKDTNEDFTLPPDLSAFQKAQPGEYRLRTTGEVVINLDYVSVWTVEAPAPGSEQEE